MRARHRTWSLRLAGRTLAGVAASVLVAACGGAGPSASGGTPVHGGTVYFAQQPDTPPNYIFPLVSSENYSPANTSDFQTLLYRPLYWFGDRGRPTIDYSLSLGDAPVYARGNTQVTITLKPNRWSDGEVVSARDVGFWIDLLKANRTDWASYVPGGFPDNVTRWRAMGSRTIVLSLNRAYNPVWFTNNELSQITPLPIAWDRTTLTEPAPTANAAGLPDTTTRGAQAVYRLLNGASQRIATYAASPLWSIVDGPWRLASVSADSELTFVPNQRYTGPQKPYISRFVEVPFTSTSAEFDVLKSEDGSGTANGSASDITVGYVPDEDLPADSALRSQGFRLVVDQPFGFDYFEPNFNNPTVGPILRQLYFRQAFQHLVNQPGWIRAFYNGLAEPTYSPVPAQPSNPYSDAAATTNPYPFDVAAARSILAAHGWRVTPGGVTTCARAGSAAGDCGAGIPAGRALRFTMLYPTGQPFTAGSMDDLQSVARRVGIVVSVQQIPTAQIDATIEPCAASSSACRWQLGNYGTSWLFAPDHDPTGEEIFETGADGNVNNYSSPMIDRLIAASTTAPLARAQATLDAYANAVRQQLPDFWQPAPGSIDVIQGALHGFVPNADDFISPEEWYFTAR